MGVSGKLQCECTIVPITNDGEAVSDFIGSRCVQLPHRDSPERYTSLGMTIVYGGGGRLGVVVENTAMRYIYKDEKGIVWWCHANETKRKENRPVLNHKEPLLPFAAEGSYRLLEEPACVDQYR
jgi:hypothetical protein